MRPGAGITMRSTCIRPGLLILGSEMIANGSDGALPSLSILSVFGVLIRSCWLNIVESLRWQCQLDMSTKHFRRRDWCSDLITLLNRWGSPDEQKESFNLDLTELRFFANSLMHKKANELEPPFGNDHTPFVEFSLCSVWTTHDDHPVSTRKTFEVTTCSF